MGVLLGLCSSLLQKSIKGGLAVTGGLNLGGSTETIFNPVAVVETAIEKVPPASDAISSRRRLNDLPDDLAARFTIHYYIDARDALLKTLAGLGITDSNFKTDLPVVRFPLRGMVRAR